MNTMPMLPGHKIPSKSILPIFAQLLWQKSVSGHNPKGWGSKVKIVTLINIVIVKTGN